MLAKTAERENMDTLHALGAKINNFTTVLTTLEPLAGRGEVRPGGYVDFELPSECLVNLSAFALHMNVRLEGDLGRVQRIPVGESLIDEVQVLCGGIRLDGGGRHVGAFKYKRDVLMGVSGDSLSKPFLHSDTDPDFGRVMAEVEGETHVCLRRFDGIFNAGVIDTSLLPPITVRIVFTTERVVVSASELTINGFQQASSNPYDKVNYVISDPHALVELIGVGSQFERLQESIISSRGYLPLLFKQYHVFSGGTGEANIRFDVSSRSLDRLWHMMTKDATVNQPAERVFNSEIYYGYYPKVLESSINTGTTYQVDLAGVQLPQRPADNYELFQQTMNSLPTKGNKDIIRSPPAFSSWRDTQYLSCLRLCAHMEDVHNSSGLDTRDVTLSGTLNLTNPPSGYRSHIITESTAELRIRPGREVELIP